ncbi:NAD(P) transhydrogenase subunit alpha [Amycolatopsis acidiphila]|uniref:proton-translocating NAD(P)(+) transhydrogenase n=1 Tax=Amycolatopsis acidiphila TaxID=715473 RepID=A0A558AJZ3_9PSEU|nr:NAD(P) transhydrogenase subunit alpha [Amycolatopsis acidiphila]TVT24580.1 NAD(P) transhydrogenase subunit alpha [Amycolatopsis acidiphila]UIJ58525.1 NAD(P) transhydrogenase subunit alpha [Amycolatopsis acidiphila]GHG77002.1 NAD(P) transhydrogenase subunit alpha [Amycolatopsis acidiphila]
MVETVPLSVGVVRESLPGERRVALVPKLVERLVGRKLRVLVESGAGEGVLLADEVFEQAGAEMGDAWSADIVLKVAPPTPAEVSRLKKGSVLIGFLKPLSDVDATAALDKAGVTSFAMESIPRITRAQAMDALSSQSSVAGYRSVLLAAERLTRFFPMLTTAAGTMPPAKVLVLGAGVAGLQALATAKRLGSRPTGYDVRPEVAEQVRSVGASWLDLGIEAVGEGGYARELTEDERAEQQRRLTEATTKFDVVITTALVPGRRAPTLVTAEAVRGMPAGGVVVDLAGESGGNCELTEPGKEVVAHDVTICSPLNLAAEMPGHASELYARNLTELVELLVDADGRLALDFSDEIVAGACVAGRERGES